MTNEAYKEQHKKEEQFEKKRTESFESAHYVFHYERGSLAEREIRKIADTQETCFEKICSTLYVVYPERINYYFADDPVEIGRLIWNENTPCNGAAICGDNKIYAVYTENVKCIGPHEDTHLISYLINYPESDFVVEGLAMAFHETWWGVPNETWTSYYHRKHPDLSVSTLFDNDAFAEIGCVIGYPVAGAFTKFLWDIFGVERYLEFYKYGGCECGEAAQSAFGKVMAEIEALFWERMNSVAFDAPTLEKMLEEEGI